MSEIERLRDQARKCRQLAGAAGDPDMERRLAALADEFDAKAVHAEAQASSRHGGLAQVGSNADERRKLALTNFNNSW
jgi:hypothetical protein